MPACLPPATSPAQPPLKVTALGQYGEFDRMTPCPIAVDEAIVQVKLNLVQELAMAFPIVPRVGSSGTGTYSPCLS
jgi:hypothetical protein